MADKGRIDNLRVISKLQGATPAELLALQNRLSPQENAVVNEIAASLFPGYDAGQGLTSLTPAQFKQLTAEAGTRLKTDAAQAPSAAGAEQGIEKAIAKDPLSQLSQAIVGQFQAEMGPIEAAVSGNLGSAAEQSAIGTALTTAGQPQGGAGAAWLQGQTQTANKATDPLSAAMAAYGEAYTAGMASVGSALSNLGQAQAIEQVTAPEQPWINAAIQHIGYPTGYENISPAQAQSLPPALQWALSQMGWTGVSAPAGGWGPNAPKTAQAPTASLGLSGLQGTPVGASTPPTSGNPAYPGN